MADFQNVLRAGERVIWSGAPQRGVRLRPSDTFLVPFSLLWGGFAVFWESSVLGIGVVGEVIPTTSFMALWGIPFVLVGLYMIFGRFLADAWVREGTRYALTNQRALIERTRLGYSLNSIELSGKPIRLTGLKADGRGTIELGEQMSMFAGSNRMGVGMWAPWIGSSALEGVEDAQGLFRKVQDVAGRMVG